MLVTAAFLVVLMAVGTVAWAEQLKKAHRRRSVAIKVKRMKLRCIRGGKP
jgi:hypothetical protein